MKLAGSYLLPGTPEDVWALLADPARLARCLPGCERLEPDGPDRYKAAVKVAVAAIAGRYAGSLEYLEKDPPHLLRLRLAGKGLPGFMTGEGQLVLTAQQSQTELRYTGEAQVGGLVASVGQRMIEGVARRILQQFFESVAAELKARAAKP